MTILAATGSPRLISWTERASTRTDRLVAGVLFLIVFGSGLVHLESFPPLWFDEGWTVCVARTWVELGHYGCLLRGEPAAPVLSAHFPVVASVAASFKLLGVGIWQARVVGLLYTFGAFLLLYTIARQLFSRPVAIVALGLLILVPVKWSIHPLFIGRQVLGEIPMLCFLLAGYACLLRIDDDRRWLAGAVACWSLAWMTKAQLAPFFIASLAGTALLVGIRGEWSTARRLALLLGASWAGYRLLVVAKELMLAGHTVPNPPTSGMTEAIALVLVPSIRLETIQYMVASWPEYTIGLGCAAWALWRSSPAHGRLPLEQTVRIMLLLLASSWLAWFALLCAGEARYAFPGLFIAAPFTAAFFCELTKGFDAAFVRDVLSALVRTGHVTGDGTKIIVTVALLFVMGWVVMQERYAFRAREDDRDLINVIAYLHTATPATALIETYDSELFLFLNRPYTYAPPQALVEVILREQKANQAVTYDPLLGKPNYIVVGEYGRWAGFYKPLITQHRVRLVQTIGRYEIYEPVGFE
jgi:4-amino-4-deoxy-L-arabinose transferase-like glycosyltransferase